MWTEQLQSAHARLAVEVSCRLDATRADSVLVVVDEARLVPVRAECSDGRSRVRLIRSQHITQHTVVTAYEAELPRARQAVLGREQSGRDSAVIAEGRCLSRCGPCGPSRFTITVGPTAAPTVGYSLTRIPH